MSTTTLQASYREFLAELHTMDLQAARGHFCDPLYLVALRKQGQRIGMILQELPSSRSVAERAGLKRQLTAAWNTLQAMRCSSARAA